MKSSPCLSSLRLASCILLLLICINAATASPSRHEEIFEKKLCNPFRRHYSSRHYALPSWRHKSAAAQEAKLQPLLPPSDGNEIDPRYSVENRLVPTGPNPLHN